ncbi:MAG: DUF3794 domain-containing protein [Candidatus Acidiferrales bacterium]
MKIKQSVILALGMLCFCVGLHSQDQKVSSRDVPEAVRSALAKTYPNAKVSNWDKEIFEGKVVYEAEGATDGKVNRNVMYSPDGNVVQIEETVPVSDLPAAITAPVNKQYPKGAIQSAEKRVHGETVEYVLRLKGAAVKKVVLDSEGKIISTK